MTEIADRRFVAFDAAVIDVDLIEAAVETTQEVPGGPNGQPIHIPITAVVMKNGSRITLGGSSRDKFIYWWRKNVEAEKIELPDPPASEVVVEAEAQTPVAPAAGPAPVVPALPPVPVVTNPVPPILTSPPEEKVSDDKK